jgi:hypothetical protein
VPQRVSLQPCHSEPFAAAISGENGEESAVRFRRDNPCGADTPVRFPLTLILTFDLSMKKTETKREGQHDFVLPPCWQYRGKALQRRVDLAFGWRSASVLRLVSLEQGFSP